MIAMNGCYVNTSNPDPTSCSFIFDVYIVGFVCIVGLIGNSLTIAVLHRVPDKQNVTNWLLQMLAAVDGFYLIFSLFYMTGRTIGVSTLSPPRVRTYLNYVALYLWPLELFVQTLTIWSVVLVTIDRFLAICFPLRSQLRNPRRIKTSAGVIFILAALYHVPLWWFYLKMVYFNGNGDELIVCLSEHRYTWYYGLIHNFFGEMIIKSVGPFLILLILNSAILIEIRAMNKKRLSMTAPMIENRTISLVLVMVVVVFFLCQLPSFAIHIAYDANKAFNMQLDMSPFSCVFSVFNALVRLNSAINFFIYCLIWKKFNRILLEMLGYRKNTQGSE